MYFPCVMRKKDQAEQGVFSVLHVNKQSPTQGGTDSSRGSTAVLACALPCAPLTFMHSGICSPNGNPARREATRRPATNTSLGQQENNELLGSGYHCVCTGWFRSDKELRVAQAL